MDCDVPLSNRLLYNYRGWKSLIVEFKPHPREPLVYVVVAAYVKGTDGKFHYYQDFYDDFPTSSGDGVLRVREIAFRTEGTTCRIKFRSPHNGEELETRFSISRQGLHLYWPETESEILFAPEALRALIVPKAP